MTRLALALAFLLPSPLLAISQDIRSEGVEGREVGTINENFRALDQRKLDARPGDIIPRVADYYTLGTANYPWRGLYLSDILVMPQAAAIRNVITPASAGQLIYSTGGSYVCLSTGTTASTWVLLHTPATVCGF